MFATEVEHDGSTPLPVGEWEAPENRYHTIDASHAVDDAVADIGQYFVGEMYPVSGHAIGACYCPQSNHLLIGSFIAHYPYTFNRQQNCTSLPNFVVKSKFFQDTRVQHGHGCWRGGLGAIARADRDAAGQGADLHDPDVQAFRAQG